MFNSDAKLRFLCKKIREIVSLKCDTSVVKIGNAKCEYI